MENTLLPNGKKKEHRMCKKYFGYIWMFILVTIEFLQAEFSCGMKNNIVSMEFKYICINWIVICFFNMLILLAVERVWLTTLISELFCVTVSVVNYYVILYHGMPLSVSELKNLKTALYVAVSYSYHIDGIVLSILAGFLISLCISILLKKEQIIIKRKISAGGLVIGLGVIYISFFSPNSVKPKVTIGWSWKEACREYGYISYLVEDVYGKKTGVIKPEHYSLETVEEKCSEYKERQSSQCNELPDVILILNETFYDLHQVVNFQTDQDYLTNIKCIEDMACGYAVSPALMGGTNGAEYEVLTSNSLYLIKQGAPFNSLELENSSSLAGYLRSLGYSTLGTHSETGTNYNRIYGYNALGFEEVKFQEDYENCWSYDGRMYKSDYSVYENIKKWYTEMGDRPRFVYCLTIQNHGGWDMGSEEFDTIHVTEGDVGETDIVNEYLTSISHSDEAFSDFIEYFKTITDRKVVVCMLGDHAPSFAATIATPEYSEAERNMLLGATPLYIWSNYELENMDLGYMSMHYVAPTLLDAAGIPMSPYYMYLMDTKREVPIIASWGKYYDKDYECYDIGGGKYSQVVDDYFCVEYNNIKGEHERVTEFYKLDYLATE